MSRLITPAFGASEGADGLPLRVGLGRNDQPDDRAERGQDEPGRKAGPIAVALAFGQVGPCHRRQQPDVEEQERLGPHECEQGGQCPRYAFWTSGLVRNASELSDIATLPVSRTYARLDTSSAKFAFCSTSRIVIPRWLISAIVS